MAQSVDLAHELVHLARLALIGRPQDVQLYLRRLIKKLRQSHPDTAEQLKKLLIESPTRLSPLRGETIAAIPLDQDSRLQLARLEYPVEPRIEPIWSPGIRRELQRVVAERECEASLLQADLLPTRSILLTGPPGVGKTLAARWIAHALQRPLVILDLAAVMSSFLGRTGNNVRYVLDYAKSVDCILFLDEFDAVAKRRDDSSEVGELKRLVTVLLQEIDDWPPKGILIAATNHPDLLDPAVWRRFEMVLDLPMPPDDQVELAVRTFIGTIDNAKSESLFAAVAKVLHGLSFSEIERELTNARRESVVQQEALERSLERLIGRRSVLLSQEARTDLALFLIKLSYSQRRAHELTGVHRDTIRSLSNKVAMAV
jgi:SpoVK/Ycf46/Vps4 family AAA+-type ATPase